MSVRYSLLNFINKINYLFNKVWHKTASIFYKEQWVLDGHRLLPCTDYDFTYQKLGMAISKVFINDCINVLNQCL